MVRNDSSMKRVSLRVLQHRADIVYGITDWFEKEQKIHPIPIVVHARPLAEIKDLGAVFGICSSPLTHCLLASCEIQYLHIHISLMSAFEFYGTNRKLDEMTHSVISEMDMIRSTLEELFHYWQSENYPLEYVKSLLMSLKNTKENYFSNSIEHEAKSFSWSVMERYLEKTWFGKSLEFLRDVLFNMRALERQK